MNLPLDSIHPNPAQPRQRFDQEALQELADSIGQLGVLQPIAVQPDGDGFMIVAGERRWRASRMAGLSEIPVVILDGTEEELFAKSVAENVARADMTIIEEAHAFQRLLDHGHDIPQIAKLVGKVTGHVTYRLALLDLDPSIQAVVNTGQIPTELAWYMASLGQARQREVLRKWANGEFPSQKAAHAYCEAAKLADSQEVIFDIQDIPEVTARQQRARTRTEGRLAAIGRAMTELTELFEKSDEELARDLGSEVAANLREQLDLLHLTVGRLRSRAVKVEQISRIGEDSLLTLDL